MNKDLIERKRKELNAQRKAHHKNELKMDIGCATRSVDIQSMEEIEFLGIMVDRCTTCSGIYFDKGEFEILLESKEQKGFFEQPKSLRKNNLANGTDNRSP